MSGNKALENRRVRKFERSFGFRISTRSENGPDVGASFRAREKGIEVFVGGP
jgi:hypothetical protein